MTTLQAPLFAEDSPSAGEDAKQSEPICTGELDLWGKCGFFGVDCPAPAPQVLRAPALIRLKKQEASKVCPDLNTGFKDLGSADEKQWWTLDGPLSGDYDGFYRVLKNEGEKTGNIITIDMDAPCLQKRFTLKRVLNKTSNVCEDFVEAQDLEIKNGKVELKDKPKSTSAKVTYAPKDDKGVIKYTFTDEDGDKENRAEEYWDGNNAAKDIKNNDPVQMVIEMGDGHNFDFIQKPKPDKKNK